MRGSLRDLALERLGGIERAVVASGFLREDLLPGAAPAILLKGTAIHAVSRARATRINVVGIDDAFPDLYPTGAPELETLRASDPALPPVVLNETLARELSASPGDAILLHVPRSADAPPDTVLGRRDTAALVTTMRCTVRAVMPDRGPGRFSLDLDQRAPRDLFLALRDLQKAAGRAGRVNLLLLSVGAREDPDPAGTLANALDLEDLGIILSRTPDFISLEARQFVLAPGLAEAIDSAAASLGASLQHVQTSLAIEMRAGDRSIPYSTVSAVDPLGAPFPGLTLVDGNPVARVGDGEVLLDEWAAEALGAPTGATMELDYFELGESERLLTATTTLRLNGIVVMTGLAADRTLTPDYPGIRDARDIAAWDPPFPMNLTRIGPRDEQYWDRFGATPKAFVSIETARRLWSTRYGSLTAMRVAPPAGQDPQAFMLRLAREIKTRIPLESAGLRLRDLREEGMRAAEGTTDFSALFLAFSFFLIVSCALLCGLIFRLGVERRAPEIGVLLATGYPVRSVRRRFLAQGLALAGAGAALGLPGGAAYAGLMMLGLGSIWRGAAGSGDLHLHVGTASLLIGGAVSIGTVMIAIAWSVRRLGRIRVPALLSGDLTPAGGSRGTRAVSWIAFSCLGLAAAMMIGAMLAGTASSAALSFGAGAAALASALAFFARWCRAPRRWRAIGAGRGAFAAMAARNCSWNPGRSLLSLALIGSACFVIVTVAASRRDSGEEGPAALDSTTGGYSLFAEAEIPLHEDPGTPQGRADLGIPDPAGGIFDATAITSLRVVPGDDASCLNLYRPERPRLLGVPGGQIRRGGFRFSGLARPVANPWDLLREPIEPGVVPAFGDEASVLWILHLGLGRDLAVDDELGRPLRLRFVGLLEGSPFQSELLISEEDLLTHFPSRSGYAAFLIDAPVGKTAAVSRVLEETLAPHGFDATPMADRIAGYSQVENTYLATFQVLGGLGLLMGSLGLGIVVARNVLERRGELATLRAFGFARGKLARLLLMENLVLMAFGILAGTGAALAAVAPQLAVVGRTGGAPWIAIGLTLAAVLAAGMASTLVAVLGALRAPLLRALREER
jgi:ABC-type lipoprotein release transport system permease subunit